MAVTGTNQIKNNANGTGQFKLAWGGYGYARYGMSYYGQVGGATNQNKLGTHDFLVTDEGDFLVTDEGDFIILDGRGVVNQSKT